MNCPKCNEDIMSMSIHYCNAKPEPKGSVAPSCSADGDFMAIYSARYILEDMNNPRGIASMSEVTGLPQGVIADAFANIFKQNTKDQG